MANQDVAENRQSRFAETFEAVRRPLRETVGELRKVHWPTRLDVRNLTTIIFAVTAAMAILLGAFDTLFDRLFVSILQATPSLVGLAVLIVIVLTIAILVVYSSRERR